MSIQFRCPKCNALVVARDEHAGRNAKCVSCRSPVVVPQGAETQIPTVGSTSAAPSPPVPRRPPPPPPVPQNPFAFLQQETQPGGLAAPVAHGIPALQNAAASPQLNISVEPSVRAKLQGMWKGRYLVNHNPVFIRFTGSTIEAKTYSISRGLGIALGTLLGAVILLLIVGMLVLMAAADNRAQPGLLLNVAIGKFVIAPLVAVLIAVGVFVAAKIGRPEVVRIERSSIIKAFAVGKWAAQAGVFTAILESTDGTLRVIVPEDEQMKVHRFFLEAMGIDIRLTS